MLALAFAICLVAWLAFACLVTWALGRKYYAAVRYRAAMGFDRSLPRQELQVVEDFERYCLDGPQHPPESFVSSLGLKIMVYSWWPPPGVAPKAVVLYCPGLDACADVDLCARGQLAARLGYRGSWVEALCDAGFRVECCFARFSPEEIRPLVGGLPRLQLGLQRPGLQRGRRAGLAVAVLRLRGLRRRSAAGGVPGAPAAPGPAGRESRRLHGRLRGPERRRAPARAL